jgi:RNA polymerase sigma-70 factor (ECF subfamily)
MNPQILLAHESFVRALARTLLADEDRADDAVQETWLAALASPPRAAAANDVGGVRAWLSRVVRNFVRQQQRASARRARRERIASRGEAIPSAREIVEIESARRRLVDAVLALDEPCRTVILLRFYGDKPPRTIARQLGVPVETVRSRLKRGLRQLRERLGAGARDDWFHAAPLLASLRIPFEEIAAGAPPSAAVAAGAVIMKTGTKVACAVLLVAGALAVLSPLLVDRFLDAGRTGAAATPSPGRAPSHGTADRGAPPPPPDEGAETAPGPAAAAAVAVTGVVRDAGGAPVPGAKVVSFAATIGRAVSPDEPGSAEGPVRAARTDASGRFAVAVDPQSPVASLIADAAGFSPAFVDAARAGDDVVIGLDRARVLTGFVRDLAGKPVPGAKVTWLGLLARARIERSGTAAADGAYRVDGIPSPEALRATASYDAWVQAVADGFAPMVVPFGWTRLRAREDLTFDLFLPRGATLRGRILDADTQEPVPNATVVLWTTGASIGFSGWDSPYGYAEVGRTTSDDAGRYVMARIPAEGIPYPAIGHYDERGQVVGFVAAFAPGYVAASGGVSLVADGESVAVDLLCWPAAGVEGRVVDERGRPVAGASVQCATTGPVARRGGWLPERYRDALRSFAITDADGRYAIRGCAAPRSDAPAKVEALDVAYAKVQEGWSETRPSAEIVVHAGRTTSAPDLVMTPFPGTLLRVVDASGNAVGGATVTGSGADLTTGLDGTCRKAFSPTEIRRAGSGPIEVIVRAPGFAKTLAAIPLPLAPEVRVVLGKEHFVAGRVLAADGSPADQVAIRVLNANADPKDRKPRAGPFAQPAESARGALVVYGWGRTSDDGTFRCGGLPAGPYEIHATKYGPQVPGREQKQVDAIVTGIATDAADVVLRLPELAPADPVNAIEGTLTDARTRDPIVRFDAYLKRGGMALIAAARIAPGRFRFDDVPSGTWDLSVTAKGYAKLERPGLVVVAPPAKNEPLDLGMAPGITLQGRVLTPPSVEITKLEIVVFRSSGPRVGFCVVERDGSYRVSDLEPGTYRIGTGWFASASAYTFLAPVGTEPITLRAGEPVAVRDLSFVPGGSIVFKTTSPRLPKTPYSDAIEAASDAQLAVLAASSAEIRDARGVVVWSGRAMDQSLPSFAFPPGDYVVMVALPDAEPQQKTATVKAGEVTRIGFELP